jgi:hypothetical protein
MNFDFVVTADKVSGTIGEITKSKRASMTLCEYNASPNPTPIPGKDYAIARWPIYTSDPEQDPPGWTSGDKRRANRDGHDLDHARQAYWVAMCERERSRLLCSMREMPWCPYSMRQVVLVRAGCALYWHCGGCHGQLKEGTAT